ncbi:MAG: F0F1 ATP synthase subunit gamma [Kiritimatiellae bacterium]|nr:F0F1 ATP synthase subunit gamma [Kiritimatiellia bacterium]
MQLHELKKDLVFNKDLLSLVSTLKNVAGSQFHIMEKKKQRFDAFMDAFAGFFRVVNLVDVVNPLVQVEFDITGLLIVTSDSGFMGGLNSGVIRAGLAAVESIPEEKVKLIVVGDKGAGVLDDRSDLKKFDGINQDTIYEQSVVIKDYLMREVKERRIGKLLVAYPKALSFSTQTISVTHLLPCGDLFDKKLSSEVTKHVGTKRFISESREVIVESSFDDMVEYLSGIWVTSKLFEIFEDGKLAEFSARAMHLEGSLQKVEKEYIKVKQKCFKATHELIDKGMRESFAAKSTKSRKKKRAAA